MKNIKDKKLKNNNFKYVVVSPVRDEAEFIHHTYTSMIHQTNIPLEWIIVNDGSSDGTAELIETYASKHDWIKVVHCEDRGYRKPGGGIVEAFYRGFKTISIADWDYIVKLDGDLSFSSDYFEKCFTEFLKNPKLGVGGGVIVSSYSKGVYAEKVPRFHVRGATKIYRRECFQNIDGLIIDVGWDTIDEVKAHMNGWDTYSFDNVDLKQHRLTGESNGMFRNAFKNGVGCYACGYQPIYMTLKCIYRIGRKPIIIDSLGQILGYLYSYLILRDRVISLDILKYIRKQQIRSLMGKSTIWK